MLGLIDNCYLFYSILHQIINWFWSLTFISVVNLIDLCSFMAVIIHRITLCGLTFLNMRMKFSIGPLRNGPGLAALLSSIYYLKLFQLAVLCVWLPDQGMGMWRLPVKIIVFGAPPWVGEMCCGAFEKWLHLGVSTVEEHSSAFSCSSELWSSFLSVLCI